MAIRDEWSDFLNTPGYSTESRGKMSHDEYMREMTITASTPSSADPVIEADKLAMVMMGKYNMAVDAAKKLMEVEKLNAELEEGSLNEASMESFVKWLHAKCREEAEKPNSVLAQTFMLNGPMSLTVCRANGDYRKLSHIGGEDFCADGAYLGKRGQIILRFAPVMASDYQYAEMSLKEAMSNFAEFTGWFALIGASRRLSEIKEKEVQEKERKENEKRFGHYEDIGFGSW